MLESLRREYIYIGCIARTLWRMRHVGPDSTRTIVDIVEEIAAKRPASAAVFYQDRIVSYRQFDEGANRIARWAEAQGIKRGETVALLMENRPEYLMVWIGLIKVGVVAALINTNLRGAALAHSIAISGARHAIVGAELGETYVEAEAQLDRKPVVWAAGGAFSGAHELDGALASLSPGPIGKGARVGITGKDTALYIFTSGTTGLPKAARFTHMRMLYMMHGFAGALNTTLARPHLCRAAALSRDGGHLRGGHGADRRRRAHPAPQILGPRILGRLPHLSRDHLPVYRRAVPLSA